MLLRRRNSSIVVIPSGGGALSLTSKIVVIVHYLVNSSCLNYDRIGWYYILHYYNRFIFFILMVKNI